MVYIGRNPHSMSRLVFLYNYTFSTLLSKNILKLNRATSANVSLLMISAFVMLLPGAYTENQDKKDIMMVSRAAAIILMLMYCCLLVFVLYTHKDIMSAEVSVEFKPQALLLQTSVKSIKEVDDDLDADNLDTEIVELKQELGINVFHFI